MNNGSEYIPIGYTSNNLKIPPSVFCTIIVSPCIALLHSIAVWYRFIPEKIKPLHKVALLVDVVFVVMCIS